MRSPPGEIYPVQIFIKYASMKKNECSIDNHLGCCGEFGRYSGPKVSRQFQFVYYTAISVLLTAISICSRQFQLYSRQFQFAHGNFNLFTGISTLLTAISTCSRQFQFAHGHFNLLKAISIFNSNAHGSFRFAHHLSTSAADSGHQKSKRKFKSRCLKSILAYFIMAILFFRKCIKYLGVVIKLEISIAFVCSFNLHQNTGISSMLRHGSIFGLNPPRR